MPLPILPHSSHTTTTIGMTTISIGIIHPAVQQTTPVGSPARQSMILALWVGEFQTATTLEFGQKPSVQIIGKPHPTGMQRTKDWTFPKQTRS